MNGGFHQSRSVSPTGLIVVVGMHAAALTALALVKGPEFFDPPGPMVVRSYPVPEDPDPIPPEADAERPTPREQVSVPDRSEIPIERLDDIIGPVEHPIPLPPPGGTGLPPLPERTVDPPAPPVRIPAEYDQRFADGRQPPYPASEQRAEREGVVRVRLTIGADGRVKAVERLSATSNAFWQATQRHAQAYWRFRPATVDGQPIESRKEMNVHFRLDS